MAGHGGFEHNLQSLRVVDRLETRYPAFDGLNLTFEAREGILKHCSRRDAERLEAAEPDGVARRFLRGGQPSLEAQLANLADEVAYNAHDIDDGVRSGLIGLEALSAALPLVARCRDAALVEHPQLAGMGERRLLAETLRRMLTLQIHDIIAHTRQRLAEAAPADAWAARACGPLLAFSAEMRAETTAVKRWLFANLYRNPQVTGTTDVAREVVRELFEAYRARPDHMPEDFAGRPDSARAVADYVAGMTDRFAAREHRRLTGRDAFDGALG
jgi:dGTPase